MKIQDFLNKNELIKLSDGSYQLIGKFDKDLPYIFGKNLVEGTTAKLNPPKYFIERLKYGEEQAEVLLPMKTCIDYHSNISSIQKSLDYFKYEGITTIAIRKRDHRLSLVAFTSDRSVPVPEGYVTITNPTAEQLYEIIFQHIKEYGKKVST